MSTGVAFCSVVAMVLALLWADGWRKRCGSLRMQIICKDDNLRYLRKQHDALVDAVLGQGVLFVQIQEGRDGGYSSMVTDAQIREVAIENRLCAEKLKESVDTCERYQQENKDLARRVDCLRREAMSDPNGSRQMLAAINTVLWSLAPQRGCGQDAVSAVGAMLEALPGWSESIEGGWKLNQAICELTRNLPKHGCRLPSHAECLSFLEDVVAIVHRDGTVWNTQQHVSDKVETSPAMGCGCGVIPACPSCQIDTADLDLSLQELNANG